MENSFKNEISNMMDKDGVISIKPNDPHYDALCMWKKEDSEVYRRYGMYIAISLEQYCCLKIVDLISDGIEFLSTSPSKEDEESYMNNLKKDLEKIYGELREEKYDQSLIFDYLVPDFSDYISIVKRVIDALEVLVPEFEQYSSYEGYYSYFFFKISKDYLQHKNELQTLKNSLKVVEFVNRWCYSRMGSARDLHFSPQVEPTPWYYFEDRGMDPYRYFYGIYDGTYSYEAYEHLGKPIDEEKECRKRIAYECKI